MAAVRQPVRVTDSSNRTLEQRLMVRFPALARASGRLLDRLAPESGLRRAAVARAIRLGIEAYNRRDLDAVVSGYDPNIEYFPYREFVEAGLTEPSYHGHDGYKAYIDAQQEVWGDDVRLDLTEVIDLGDRVVMLADMPMRAQASGIALSQKYAGVLTLKDGRVVEQRDFLDQAEALAAVGLR